MAHRRVNYVYSLQECFRRYKKLTRNNVGGRISEAKFKEIFNTFLSTYMETCWEKGQPAKLPFGLGSAYIEKFKGKIVDRYQSKLQRKRVNFNNDATAGYVYKIKIIHGRGTYAWVYKANKTPLREILTAKIREFVKLGRYYPAYKIT